MAKDEDAKDDVIETLTDEEQKVLAKAMKKVEAEVFQRVVKRLSAWAAVVLTLLLVGGLVNLNACYSNVESSTAQKLASDPELRDKVISRAQENLTVLQEKLKKLNEQTLEMEKENARAANTFVSDLQQIRFMLERVNSELSGRMPADKNPTIQGGKQN